MLKRSDGRWQEQIKLPGMAKPKYFYGKTQKEVKQKMAEWKQEQTAGKLFSAAADAWAEYHAQIVSHNGAIVYNAPLKQAKDHFSGRFVHDIGPNEINAYIIWVAGRGYARRTVQVHLDMLNMIYNYAIIQRWCENNPCTAVKLPGGLPKGKRELPSDEELSAVKRGVELEFGLFPFMLLHTGMRRGELLALRWEDIDYLHRIIYVNKAIYFDGNTPCVKPPKTEAGNRTVMILDELMNVLPGPGVGYVFGGEKPLTLSAFLTRWKNWCRAAGVKITPHQLRHAFATVLFDAGIDVKDAQDILGHASMTVTRDIYTHIRKQRREETARRVNAFLSGQKPENDKDCQKIVNIGESVGG